MSANRDEWSEMIPRPLIALGDLEIEQRREQLDGDFFEVRFRCRIRRSLRRAVAGKISRVTTRVYHQHRCEQ